MSHRPRIIEMRASALEMAAYWIVVRRENVDLFEALSVAFRGRTGFCVVVDRRISPDARRRGIRERRGAQTGWGPDEFIVAERLDPLM